MPPLFKVYKRLIYDQLTELTKNNVNSVLYSCQKTHYKMMLYLWCYNRHLDNQGFEGRILMDLSNTHNCMYEVTGKSLKLILNYRSRHKKITKIGSSVSTWYDLITGVLPVSIFSPSLFDIFKNGLFLFISQPCTCNFAGDNTLLAETRYCRRYFGISSGILKIFWTGLEE